MSAAFKKTLGLCAALFLAAAILLGAALHTNVPREAAPIQRLISGADRMSFSAMNKAMDAASASLLKALGGPQTKEDFFGLCGVSINSALGEPQHIQLVAVSPDPAAENTFRAVVRVEYQDAEGQKQVVHTSVEYVVAEGRVLC